MPRRSRPPSGSGGRRGSHDRLGDRERDHLRVCHPSPRVSWPVGQEIVSRVEHGDAESVESPSIVASWSTVPFAPPASTLCKKPLINAACVVESQLSPLILNTSRSRATCRTGRPDSNTRRTRSLPQLHRILPRAPIVGASPSASTTPGSGGLGTARVLQTVAPRGSCCAPGVVVVSSRFRTRRREETCRSCLSMRGRD